MSTAVYCWKRNEVRTHQQDCRLGISVCCAVVVALVSLTPFQVCRAAAPRKTLVLESRPTGDTSEPGILVRELARQALLISARDECGLLTRDVVLREKINEISAAGIVHLDLSVQSKGEQELLLKVTKFDPKEKGETLKELNLSLPATASISTLASHMERVAREDLVEALEQAGCKRKSAAPIGTAELSPDVSRQLSEMNGLAQFAAIRELHAQTEGEGESAALLAGLARGYANLGMLTEYYWSPAHKVFKARALLYAERLVVKAPAGLAYRTRAYVRTLVGLHADALKDAKSASRAADAKAATPEERREAKLLESYCNGDEQNLVEEIANGPSKTLALYLRLLAADVSDVADVRIAAAEDLLRAQPTSLRAMLTGLLATPLGTQRVLSSAAFSALEETTDADVLRIAKLPRKIQELASQGWDDPSAETQLLPELIHALKEATATGDDAGEPSLAAAGILIQDAAFVVAWRLMNVEKFMLAVNGDDTLRTLQPLIQGHPFEDFILAHAWEWTDAAEPARRLVNHVGNPHVETTEDSIVNLLQRHNLGKRAELKAKMLQHGDLVFRDLVYASRYALNNDARKRAAKKLRDVSPFASATIAATISLDWDHVAVRATDWETTYARDLMVQEALARRYRESKDFAGAERCLKRRIEILPNQATYKELAGLYAQQEQTEKWVQTLKDSLDVPSFGLEHAQTHVDLARHYMQEKDFDAAIEHADAGAESWSAWSMICASECHEQLGHWKESEQYIRQTSERYENEASRWYYWCRRTGHGNVAGARLQAQEQIEQYAAAKDVGRNVYAGLYQYLEGNLEEALTVFRDVFARDHNAIYGLTAALIADELNDSSLRNELIEESLKAGRAGKSNVAIVVHAFRNALRTESPVPLDLPVLEWRMPFTSKAEPTVWSYFIGHFLTLRGRADEATPYLQFAAASPHFNLHVCAMAGSMLSKRKIPREPLRDEQFAGERGTFIDALRAPYFSLGTKENMDAAFHDVQEVLKFHPEMPEALYVRARYGHQQGRYAEAIADYTACLKQLPGATEALYGRALCHYLAHDFAEAVRDFEQAIKIDPDYGEACHDLCFLLATCPDASIRDGKRALVVARQSLDADSSVERWIRLSGLAAAFAENGDFDEAIRAQEEVLKIVPKDSKERHEARLKLYQSRMPYRREAP